MALKNYGKIDKTICYKKRTFGMSLLLTIQLDMQRHDIMLQENMITIRYNNEKKSSNSNYNNVVTKQDSPDT